MTSLQTASIDEIREFAARMCRDYLTGRWKVITADQLIVKRISGGLSNFLYYVSLPEDDVGEDLARNTISHKDAGFSDACEPGLAICNDGNVTEASTKSLRICESEPRDVLLRIYGQTHGEDALEAMIAESVVFALLSERNFGPKLYGIFPGGRIEQYIPARPLKTKELSYHKISMKIAEKMGEIHSLNIPMSKEPDWVWNCMDRWLTSMNNILQHPTSNNSNILIHEVGNFDYSMEIMWLKATIDQGNYAVLFCHNDLQEGNILFREDTTLNTAGLASGKLLSRPEMDGFGTSTELESMTEVSIPDGLDPDLRIIDFEYCAYNYRGFDLANHFLEWSFDYTNSSFPFFFYHKHQYPTKKQRHNFIAAYLKQLNHSVTGYEPTEQEIQGIEDEVKLFSMFSHLFWSLWSIINVTSNIEFGYREYACTRIQEYLLLKQDYNNERNAIQSISE